MQTTRIALEPVDLREKLLIAIKEYKITLNTLNKVTDIEINWLSDFINGKKELYGLPHEKISLLLNLTIFLIQGGNVIKTSHPQANNARGDLFLCSLMTCDVIRVES
ncbi:hypothetical protein SAMN02746098_01408 [Desulfosporosinus lacus DSM 15449]|uniref:Uncharacterized protein n=2 Tax=Desulfosporosinus TaxID=79206 RepID=A0A1M5VME1_9FIRM|nr:hypothetical protein SAMN02746098_01408 [Desulfosporosinus lacus DSM 15449]